MREEVLRRLCCPACGGEPLQHSAFCREPSGEIRDGVVWCAGCRSWYPIEDRLLELLTGALAYRDDRARFWSANAAALIALGLAADETPVEPAASPQAQQQAFFDSYSGGSASSYRAYEETRFWRAADRLAFAPWRAKVEAGKWLLDVGCAQGRSTFKLTDLPLNIVGFDVSKHLIREAIERSAHAGCRAQVSFLVADASRFPFAGASFDYVLLYGVLHHLPDPLRACHEVVRVLKPGGLYFGSENNPSVLRGAFDVLQKLFPLWQDDAGPEAVISRAMLRDAFSGSDMGVTTQTSIFLPPHLINLLPAALGAGLLRLCDRIGQAIPFVRDQGGLILIEGRKRAA